VRLPGEVPRWPIAVRCARGALDLSMIRFARMARVTRQTATEWEHLGTYPRAPAFARILLELRRQGHNQQFENLLAAAARGPGVERRRVPR
jgi:hypothetical protein